VRSIIGCIACQLMQFSSSRRIHSLWRYRSGTVAWGRIDVVVEMRQLQNGT
jgi:hypothetical protein